MSLLVVGSLGLDTVETPFGTVKNVIGGTAVFCSVAASHFTTVNLVGVVGEDFPKSDLEFLLGRGIDLDGIEIKPGKSFSWGGRYGYDLNTRDTLFTHLNVFETFNPRIPEKYRDTPFVFLGNIGPELQLSVLEQIKRPQLVALDTMNYWIERTPAELARVLARVHVLLVNDSEMRELSGEYNLVKAARRVRQMGPRIIIVKKGEHGAIMIIDDRFFYAPAYPLENVFDPTGAGDTFAGGFMGYVAKCNKVDEQILRQAVIYGSTFASFVVEDFSINRLRHLHEEEIRQRFGDFYEMTRFVQP
ncbi:MAG: PfkB family carbohydrate kinase [candidate division KSB1 bacterium]|nr:PfkB family carbohydrate kinase [candidate division KSB1 bacterium]MDZ7304000.1 PfkB family carbohydrate kinase [candidate division KSB1 bacterium]MDZ7313290.1 PfkB family carbohydrate kinase [candidate division KSB1 bacterium]